MSLTPALPQCIRPRLSARRPAWRRSFRPTGVDQQSHADSSPACWRSCRSTSSMCPSESVSQTLADHDRQRGVPMLYGAPNARQPLAGMPEVDDADGVWEQFRGRVPDPLGTVAGHHLPHRSGEPEPLRGPPEPIRTRRWLRIGVLQPGAVDRRRAVR